MAELERRLGLTSVVAISLSAMLGSGIFVLPGLAFGMAGPSVWLAYLAAGLCVLPAALSKAELATAMPTSGGTYVYLDRAFGPLMGTVSGLGLWLSLLLKSSFALVGFGAYLVVLADVPIRATALALLAGIVVLNIRGVRGVSRVQVLIVGLSLAVLAALSAGGSASGFDAARFDGSFRGGADGFLAAVAFVFVSYAGVTKVAAVAEEVVNPAKNLPRGILIALAIAALLYGGITLVLVGVVPAVELAHDEHPIYVLAVHVADWAPVGIAVAVVSVLTMTSMANAGILAASRFPFAMSRGKLLPSLLGRLHVIYLTPVFCIVLSAALMAAAILAFDIVRIAKLASAFMIMMFMAVNLAVVVLRESGVQWYKPEFRAPLYPWGQLFGILSGATLLVVMGPLSALAGVAIAVPGAVLYVTYGRRRAVRQGAFTQKQRRRPELLSGGFRAPSPPREDAAPEPREHAAVVVALLGKERSPEMLVEVGEALLEGGSLEVLHITELPQQTSLVAKEDDPHVESVRRRVRATASVRKLELDFHAIVSRDLVETMHDATVRHDCRWLLVAWGGRSRWTFSIYNPLGWLREHLSCNLAVFHDAGVRYVRKILVHVAPGPHDSLVIGTADHLAQVYGAELTFVRWAADDAPPSSVQSEADYLDQVRRLCTVDAETLLLRGRREELAIAEVTAAYDLLVIAGSAETGILSQIRGTLSDRLIERAACSVLELRSPRAATHPTFERYRPAEIAGEQRFLSFVEESCVRGGLAPKKKDALFHTMAQRFAEVVPEVDAETILAALVEREKSQNTALGGGIAVPHGTLPEVGRTRVGVFVTREPIDYGAPDGAGVDVFFVTLGTPGDRQTHLLLLSSIARLVTQSELLARLRAASIDAEMVAAIQECADTLEL